MIDGVVSGLILYSKDYHSVSDLVESIHVLEGINGITKTIDGKKYVSNEDKQLNPLNDFTKKLS